MSEEAKCPICGGHIEIDLNSQHGTTIDLWFKNRDDNHNMLLEALFNYWRWKAEGEKKESKGSVGEKDVQYYYDDYHNHIKYLPKEDAYEFSIQTCDSPEGDTWWRGKFKYNCWVGEGVDRHRELIHVIEEKYGGY